MSKWQIVQTKWKFKVLGGHVHVRVFVRTLPTETWAKCGNLTFSTDEWNSVRNQLPEKWILEEDASTAYQ